MKISKTILKSETGKFIHTAIFLVLFVKGLTDFVFFILFLIDLLFLWKQERKLLYLGLIMAMFVGARLIWQNSQSFDNTSTSLSGTISEVETNRTLINAKYKFYLYFSDMPSLKPGDVVEVRGRFFSFESKEIPHAFNYDQYLEAKGIKGNFMVDSIVVTNHKFHLGFFEYQAKKYLDQKFPETAKKYLYLMILGDDSALQDSEITNLTNLGISHLFAISGMHVGMLVLFLDKLFKKLYLQKKHHQTSIGIFLILYNLITGFKVSIVRATIQTISIFFLADKENGLSRLDVLSLLLVCMLVINPFYLNQVGFTLSYLISFCILLGRDFIAHENRFMQILKLTVLANLFAMPVILEINKSFGILTIPANLFFIEFVQIIFLPVSFVALFFPLFSQSYIFACQLFENCVEFCSSINMLIEFNFPGTISKMLFYLCLFGFFSGWRNKEKMAKYLLLSVCVIVMSLINNPFVSEVLVFDIGQGDGIYINSGGCKMLIDTGPGDDYDSLLAYFKGENIHKLDLLVITHMHEDHYGEANDLLEVLSINTLVINKESNLIFHDKTIIPKLGDKLVCGNLEFDVLNAYQGYANENNNSIVLSGMIGTDKWLFMGDAEIPIETEMLNNYELAFDIVKVGHHGSDSSSSNRFVETINARYALISAGKNAFGHPSLGVIALWKNQGTDVIITKSSGTISFLYYPFFTKPFVRLPNNAKIWPKQIYSFFGL